MQNCTVCNTPISDKYCPSCGQEISNKKTTFISLILDFFSNFFSVDKSFLGTSRKLLTDPRFMVENFYSGNKRFYVSPGSYILYSITGIAIHSLLFGPEFFGIELMYDGIGTQYLFWILVFPLLFLCCFFTFILQNFKLAKLIIASSYFTSLFLLIFIVLNDIINSFIVWESSSILLLFFLSSTFLWNSFALTKKQKIGYHILNVIIQFVIFISLFYVLFTFMQTDTTEIN